MQSVAWHLGAQPEVITDFYIGRPSASDATPAALHDSPRDRKVEKFIIHK